MSLDFTDDQSTLVQVMAWCRQATSHYLSQCWPWSLLPYGVTRPEWVKEHWPLKLVIHGSLLARVSHTAACRAAVVLLITSRVNSLYDIIDNECVPKLYIDLIFHTYFFVPIEFRLAVAETWNEQNFMKINIPVGTSKTFLQLIIHTQCICIKFCFTVSLTHQCTGLDIKACPGHVDLVPGHINFCDYVPDWASDFSVWACTYFPSTVHKLYRACTNIGWAHENFCRARKFLKPRARRACKSNA